MFSYKEVKSLNDLEISIYNYIIKNSDKVTGMTIRELAKELSVSSTTIIRFCNKVGCEGYSEFKYKFKEHLRNTSSEEITDDLAMLQSFFQKAGTQEFKNEIKRIAEIICSRQKVFFIGIGTSGTLGKYGARFLSNLGIKALYIDDPFYPAEGGDYRDTVIVTLSVSGEQPILHKQISGFKDGKALIVSITNTRQCTLANISDYNISYYIPMKVLPGQYNVTSQVPLVYILESIAYKCKAIKEKNKNNE